MSLTSNATQRGGERRSSRSSGPPKWTTRGPRGWMRDVCQANRWGGSDRAFILQSAFVIRTNLNPGMAKRFGHWDSTVIPRCS